MKSVKYRSNKRNNSSNNNNFYYPLTSRDIDGGKNSDINNISQTEHLVRSHKKECAMYNLL